MPMQSTTPIPLGELFEHFARGDLDAFLAGCSDRLILMARGAADEVTMVPRDRLQAWLGAQDALTGGTLRAQVCLALSMSDEHVVILRHSFVRDGERQSYETINRCSFRYGLLRGWSSLPFDMHEYRRAWLADSPVGYALS